MNAEIFARIAVSLESLAARLEQGKKPAPNVYSYGEATRNAQEFFVHFEAYATSMYGVNESAFLQILPEYLAGEAKKIAVAFGPCAEYETVKQRIIQGSTAREFLQASYDWKLFFEMKRQSNESLNVFSVRLETAANRFENLNESIKTAMVQQVFLEQLSPEIRKDVELFCHERLAVTLIELVRIATTLMNDVSKASSAKPRQSCSAVECPCPGIPAITPVVSAPASISSITHRGGRQTCAIENTSLKDYCIYCGATSHLLLKHCLEFNERIDARKRNNFRHEPYGFSNKNAEKPQGFLNTCFRKPSGLTNNVASKVFVHHNKNNRKPYGFENVSQLPKPFNSNDRKKTEKRVFVGKSSILP